MKLYFVQELDGWEQQYFPTRAAALERAQVIADHTGKAVEVEEVSCVRLTPEVLCNVLNGWGGFSSGFQLLRRVWPTGAEAVGTVERGSEELM